MSKTKTTKNGIKLILKKNISCSLCYYDNDTCPNDGMCAINNGAWIEFSKISKKRSLKTNKLINKYWSEQ